MNILLIDNGTTLLDKLKQLIPGEEVVQTWKEFTDVDADKADVIVLSGSSLMPLMGNEKEYERELQLIRSAPKPILAICFGCELVTLAFNGTLKELEERHLGLRTIHLVGPESRDITVFENHRWGIDRLPEGFKVTATSEQGPEMIQHESLPIFALQFHPENFVEEAEGDTIFLDLLKQVAKDASA